MWQGLSIAGLLFALSACAPMPPLPGDAAARNFQSVPDRAVIYLVRHPLERDFVAPVLLDDYAYWGYRQQKVAMDALAARLGVAIMSLPSGQGLIVRP